MAIRITWRGDDFQKIVRNTSEERLEMAAIALKNEVKAAISEPSPPPSDPGEEPHKDTGRLRAGISHEVDREAMVARVGTNVTYGKFLELGTKNMPARPFLRRTFDRLQATLARIMQGGS